MKRIMSYAIAAMLSLGIVGSSLQTAEAGKRERRIAAGVAIGLVGAAIIAGANDRDYRERRYRKRHYNNRRYNRRHNRAYRRAYSRPVYIAPRRVYRQPAYVAPRRVYRARYSRAHVAWCQGRYRSYRAYDNTFQPYHGGRRACYSPYN